MRLKLLLAALVLTVLYAVLSRGGRSGATIKVPLTPDRLVPAILTNPAARPQTVRA